jgi:hypothetical protein
LLQRPNFWRAEQILGTNTPENLEAIAIKFLE